MVGLEPVEKGTCDERLDSVGVHDGNVRAGNSHSPLTATIRKVDPGLRYQHSSTRLLTKPATRSAGRDTH